MTLTRIPVIPNTASTIVAILVDFLVINYLWFNGYSFRENVDIIFAIIYF